MASTQLAFIGLGAMGLPMARNLVRAGYAVTGFDRSQESRERATSEGITIAESAQAAATGAQVLFSCLPNNEILEQVYLGEAGLSAALEPGAITVDCSTVSPQVTREISAALAVKGVSHVDASMLGSTPQAEAGEIGFVIGGERHSYDAIEPLLDVLGGYRTYAGPSGAANQIKLIHQTLVAINATAVAEAVGLCIATGTDLDCFYDVVCKAGGMAYSRYFERRVPRMREGEFSPLFMAQLMNKDASLAKALAEAGGFETPVLDQALAAFAKTLEAGLGAEDFSAVMKIYETAAGKRLSEA